MLHSTLLFGTFQPTMNTDFSSGVLFFVVLFRNSKRLEKMSFYGVDLENLHRKLDLHLKFLQEYHSFAVSIKYVQSEGQDKNSIYSLVQIILFKQ